MRGEGQERRDRTGQPSCAFPMLRPSEAVFRVLPRVADANGSLALAAVFPLTKRTVFS